MKRKLMNLNEKEVKPQQTLAKPLKDDKIKIAPNLVMSKEPAATKVM